MSTSYFQKVKGTNRNLKIDVDLAPGKVPESTLNESCKSYAYIDPFVDRKNSTRTDGELRKFQSTMIKEDMRGNNNKKILNESSSITPKLGFYSIEEDVNNNNKVTKPQKKFRKVKIKTSNSSTRLRPKGCSTREKPSKIVVTKDEENNVYHIVSKDSIQTTQDLGKL